MALASPVKTYHITQYDAINPSRPELSAAGKVVVISGGGNGIGQATARAFATAGSTKIAILGRTEKTLKSTKLDIEKTHDHCKVLPIVTDVISTESVSKAFDLIKSTFGQVDILISNAGHINTLSLLADSDIDDWWHTYEVNVKGSLNVIKAFLSPGIASSNASVVNVSTASSHAILSGQTPYGSSKLAAARVFEVLQVEHPEMQVLNVHPGTVYTALGKKVTDDGQILEGVPWDDVELSAGSLVWSASPEAQFLKGRFIWANWDVEELKAIEKDIAGSDMLTFGLYSFPKLVLKTWEPKKA